MKINSDRVFVTELDGEAVILDAYDSRYTTANASAAFLLDRLRSDVARDDLVAMLAQHAGLAIETAAVDVDNFVALLRDRDWLRSED